MTAEAETALRAGFSRGAALGGAALWHGTVLVPPAPPAD